MTFVPKGMKSEEEYANIVTSSECLAGQRALKRPEDYF